MYEYLTYLDGLKLPLLVVAFNSEATRPATRQLLSNGNVDLVNHLLPRYTYSLLSLTQSTPLLRV